MGAAAAARNPPRCSSMKKTTTLQHLFEMDSKLHGISSSTLLAPSTEPETDELISMISYCTFVFTFTDSSESPLQHELKRHKLLHILSAVRSPKRGLLSDDRFLSSLITMLSANLFRPIPPPAYPCIPPDTLDEESPAIAFTPSWPHLHIVYDILAALVSSADSKILQSHINRSFLCCLVSLFQSEDPRERDRLKNVYHQIYSRLTSDRGFMRKSMNNVFLHFACDTERHCGIAELLEICGSIINGFMVPLKEEHKQFLVKVLLPLHKHKGMQGYHQQLSYCVSQFMQKEPELIGVVVRRILKYWPVTNCHKELLLIGELEELVLSVELEQLDEVAVLLCSQVARCLNSTNSQVAEKALYLWNNEQFVKMAMQSKEGVLPAVVESLENNIKCHWNKTVQDLTISVKKMIEELEPGLYSKCLMELQLQKSISEQEEKKRKERWERLELAAANKNLFLQPNCVAYASQ
ncbi:hypothetical protein J5N97_023950 [Dioscorea zingiberensis]|uniref:Serine/threonine protein phosphatase 2A regulatory subunit n=1 Tax=Dioscorea zingiberensis TaxID=325984 RepID=A0A9D5C6D6_9LILI|nr:hypothetical protein J5N97_023950 [Dioscorea zingiberensis]